MMIMMYPYESNYPSAMSSILPLMSFYIYIYMNVVDIDLMAYHIYPTPPLGQDMPQGQFF